MTKGEIIRLAIASVIVGLFTLYIVKNQAEKDYLQLQGEYNILKNNYNLKKSDIIIIENNRQIEKDSLLNIISKKDAENSKLLAKYSSLEDKIRGIKDKPIRVPKDVTGLVEYFNVRYDTKENVIVEDKVGLNTKTAYKASYELEEKDNLSDIVLIKDEQLDNRKFHIINLEKNINSLNQIIFSAENEIEERKKLQEISDENINNLEKQVKKINKSNKINKILIPVGIVVGGFIGTQIVK